MFLLFSDAIRTLEKVEILANYFLSLFRVLKLLLEDKEGIESD